MIRIEVSMWHNLRSIGQHREGRMDAPLLGCSVVEDVAAVVEASNWYDFCNP